MNLDDNDVSYDAAQLPLLDDHLSPGAQWRNVHTGEILTVLSVKQRKQLWVRLRRNGRTTELALRQLERFHERYGARSIVR